MQSTRAFLHVAFSIGVLAQTSDLSAAVDCRVVTPSSPLVSKLACTPNHFSVRLGAFLRPVADRVSLNGTVLSSGDGIDPPRAGERCLPFSYDDFLNPNHPCIGRCADGDFTFFIELDTESVEKLARLNALDPWRALLQPGFVHVEAVAYGRNAADRSQALFPGWHDKTRSVAVNDKRVVDVFSCTAEAGCVCTEPRLSNQDLRGTRVTVEGALVVDCNDAACETATRFLEIHPVEVITIHPKSERADAAPSKP